MKISPANLSTITKAIEEALKNADGLQDATIERSAEMNQDPARCPWVSVYRMGVRYPTRSLGMGSGFRRHRVEMAVFVQESDGSSGADCEDRLEDLIVKVVSVLLSDPTLGGTVDTVDDFEIRYIDFDMQEEQYVQTAAIYLTTEGVVNVT